jgi:hypothetical protein
MRILAMVLATLAPSCLSSKVYLWEDLERPDFEWSQLEVEGNLPGQLLTKG